MTDTTERQPTNGVTRTVELLGQLVLTRDEVAELLSVKTPTIDNLHESGRLRAVRIGKENRWKPSAVQEYVESLEPGKG